MEILSKKEIDELTAQYPLYSQDSKDGDTLALYHLFIGSADWYVTEGSREGDTVTLFGLVNMGGNVEMGYFSLAEMESIKVSINVEIDGDGQGETEFFAYIEKDRYFRPTKLKDLKGERVRDWLESVGYIDAENVETE